MNTKSAYSVLNKSDAFWHYSLHVYGVTQTKDCLLYLQDEADLNVNILLFSGYLASIGQLLYASDIKRIYKAIKPLDYHTLRLRTKRRRFTLACTKACSGQSNFKLSTYYKALLAAEIMSEKIQQEAIVKAADYIFKRPASKDVSYVFQSLESELVKSAHFFANNKLDCPGLDLSTDLVLERSMQIKQKISVLVKQFSMVGH